MRRTFAAAICRRRLSPASSGWPRRQRRLDQLAVFRRQEVHLQRDLFRRRLAAQFLHQAALHADLPVDALDHVHGDADGARLVGDGPADRLADPPRRVGAELVAQGRVELLHRAQQADVALLDQVEERHAAADVALRHADDQAQVGLGQPLFRVPAALPPQQQLVAGVRLEVVRLERLGGLLAIRDRIGQGDLFLAREQRGAADLVQIHAHRIAGDRRIAPVVDDLVQRLARLALDFLFQLDVALDRGHLAIFRPIRQHHAAGRRDPPPRGPRPGLRLPVSIFGSSTVSTSSGLLGGRAAFGPRRVVRAGASLGASARERGVLRRRSALLGIASPFWAQLSPMGLR